MSKIKTLALALGTTAALGVAILPLAAYAETMQDTATLDVNVNINSIISMTLESHSAAGTKTTDCDSVSESCTGDEQVVRTTILPNSADTTSMYTNIYVSTNSPDGYVLTVADSDNNANLETAGGDTIAPISSLPAGGTNPGWAVQIDGQSSWLAMPTSSGTAITIKSYAPSPKAVTTNDLSRINYGVATSNDQATGTYTDTITYTATAN